MATVIPFHRGGPGLGPTRVVALHDDLVEPWAEVDAVASEAVAFANGVLILSRQIQLALAADKIGVAAMLADRLERAAPQQEGRARRAQALARLRQAELAGTHCADGIAEPGHGRAA